MPVRRILVYLSITSGWDRALLRGIYRYARPLLPWSLNVVPLTDDDATLASYFAVQPHGVIGMVDRRVLILAQKRGCPTVRVYGPTAPVAIDERAISAHAAEFLRARGHRRFAAIADTADGPMRHRAEWFREELTAAGLPCEILPEAMTSRPAEWEARRERRRAWLAALKRPVAVFAPHDPMGAEVIEDCRFLGLAVPEEVAVLGVDDDDLVCQSAYPTLSSIRLPVEQLGEACARVLDQRMDPRAPAAPPTAALLPLGVHERQSTIRSAIEDSVVAQAMAVIRANLAKPISVDSLSRSVGCSRRNLERRFRTALDRSILDHIRASRLERACVLLAETELALGAVAGQVGLSGAKELIRLFHAELTTTPGRYREQTRASSKDRPSVS